MGRASLLSTRTHSARAPLHQMMLHIASPLCIVSVYTLRVAHTHAEQGQMGAGGLLRNYRVFF